ncbi:hypothetical protein EMPS_10419 [Entomortierella parvispora]|uniref:Protein-serine/threonine kinase n=1 Tax=Entomortierella parvispora TaxID=205924 RepID=A0A9P3HJW1_9FUNG|nr:hypothetical protein EMPS_10419 [Entomortierella parvispora]
MSHALSMLNNSSNLLPLSVVEMPTFQKIARSYLEDISLMTQIPKPSTPQLEEQFTALLFDLEQRHALKMLTIDQGVRELVVALQGHRDNQANDACSMRRCSVGESSNNSYNCNPCPEDAAAIQSFFNRFYTINLGTRLLIGEHLALKYSNENLVKRLNPLKISQNAIREAQDGFVAHCHQQFSTALAATRPVIAIPTVEILTSCPSSNEMSATYVEEFLRRNIVELLKNAMHATCETHQSRLEGDPWTLAMGTPSTSSAKRSALPPIRLTLVHGEEDVSIKITDEGGGFALSELDRIWSFAHASLTSSSLSAMTTKPSSKTLLFSPPAPFKISMGCGLPLARLIARYFGGDLTVVPLDGHGTDSYLSLYRNDDHLENFPELETEMLDEVDVLVDDLLDRSMTLDSSLVTDSSMGSLSLDPLMADSSVSIPEAEAPSPPPSLPTSMLLGLGKTSPRNSDGATTKLLLPRVESFLPPPSPSLSEPNSPAL